MRDHDHALSAEDLRRLRALIYEKSGINLSPDKKTMLELRIRSRLRDLEMISFEQYCEYLFGPEGEQKELVHFLNVVTTNKTDFFREPAHFKFLVNNALPELMARNRSGRPLSFWSAGCSTGEEPYTLAMVLDHYAQTHPSLRFKVLATDLSTAVLEKANRAIFTASVLAPVPEEMRRRYFMRSRDRESDLMRAVPELRRMVEFRQLNFMDNDYGLAEKVDAIFCRNVIIYFDRATQEKILQKLTHQLVPGGYTFLGHSESLNGLDVPLLPIAPALYRKADHA